MKRSTKAKIKDKIVNISIDMLEHFYNIGGNTFDYMLDKSLARKTFNNYYYKEFTQVPFAKWLYRLRDQGYIRYTQGTKSIEFTTKTKIKFLKEIGKNSLEIEQYHYVSFDVPEIYKKRRDYFRQAIKKLGFKQIQRSLWVANRDVYDLVQEIAFEYKVEKYIVNVISARSDIDGILDKMFIL